MTLGIHGDALARNASLDANYGTQAATSWPDNFNFRLFQADPVTGGAELASTGGYAPLNIANSGTNFPDAVGGVKSNGVAFSLTASTGAWPVDASHWGLESGGIIYDSGPVTDPSSGTPTTVTVSQANVTVRFGVGQITITIPEP